MKLPELLIVTCCSMVAARSEITETEQEALLKRASEQLERLALYRNGAEREEASNLPNLLEIWKSPVGQDDLGEARDQNADQDAPWQILEVLPEETKSDAAKQDDEKRIAIDIIADPKYSTMMQERIKRGFDAGSASLLKGIAGGLISGVASASSSSAAKASSSASQHQPTYTPSHNAPPVYSYEEKPFGPWDFKTAIFGTLLQAFKALGGGVLALKGQLVKGSGYLLSAKGRAVSKTGDVITSFGKQLASSVSTQSKPYSSDAYVYDHHPPVQDIEHGQGPPSGHDDYSDANDYVPHSYAVPSDDSDQGGLLIVTPMKSDANVQYDQHASAPQEKPDLAKLEESFGGPAKGSVVKDFLSSVPKGSTGSQAHQTVSQDNSNYSNHNNNNNVDSYPALEHPPPTYGAPEHYSNHNDPPTQTYGNYPVLTQDNQAYQPELPHITSSHHVFPHLGDNLSIQPSVENSPLQFEQFEYPTSPNGVLTNLNSALASPHDALTSSYNTLTSPYGTLTSSLLDTPKLPHDDGASVYASLSVDPEAHISPVKTPLLLDYPSAFDLQKASLPKVQPLTDFHGHSQFADAFHGSLDGPLRIHLRNPVSTHYSFAPSSSFGALNTFRKRNVLQRRTFANRFARYASLQAARRHRL